MHWVRLVIGVIVVVGFLTLTSARMLNEKFTAWMCLQVTWRYLWSGQSHIHSPLTLFTVYSPFPLCDLTM